MNAQHASSSKRICDGAPVQDVWWCLLYNHSIALVPVYVGTRPMAPQLRALTIPPILPA